jgi:hypothetical protein
VFGKTSTKPNFNKEITSVLEQLDGMSVTTPEYAETLTILERLAKVQTQHKGKTQVSADAIVTAAASLGGIALILGFERAHVITTKALGFVAKLK